MISLGDFQRIYKRLDELGYARGDVAWAQQLSLPKSPENFAAECIFVICNSGMRWTVANKIYTKVMKAVEKGRSAATVFGHKGKASAIDSVWRGRVRFINCFLTCEPSCRLDWLESLPWIGPITKYHLAKNFGLDVAKPDVHMVRLAKVHKTTPQALCEDLAKKTGYRVATIDTLLWRAAATGVIDSRTGQIVEVMKEVPV